MGGAVASTPVDADFDQDAQNAGAQLAHWEDGDLDGTNVVDAEDISATPDTPLMVLNKAQGDVLIKEPLRVKLTTSTPELLKADMINDWTKMEGTARVFLR